MFERFKNRSTTADDGATAATVDGDRDRVTTADERSVTTADVPPEERTAAHPRGTVTRETMSRVRARQREEYGGLNWGAAFFGWLVTVGLAAILLGLLSAAGAAFGLSEVNGSEATDNAETIGIVGGILLIAVLMAAYFFGGYVSGRMSRFDGGRQGLGVWAIALAVTIVLAVAGAIIGAEYNVLERLDLPRIPVEEGTITTGAAVALAIALVGTLIAAMAGGKAGERYHRKVDRAGYRT